MAKKSGTRTVHRSAITGRFITANKAKKHPKTTIKQKVRSPKKRK